MRGQRILVVAVLMAVVAMLMTMAFAPGASPVGSVVADDFYGFQDCSFSDSVVMAFYRGFTDPNAEGECRFNPTDTVTELEEEMDQNETYDAVLRVAEVRDSEERLINSLLNEPQYAKSAARQEAELVYADAYLRGESRSDSISAARDNIHGEYDERLLSLAERYNRDVRNARDTLDQLERSDAEEYLIIYVDGEQVGTGADDITFDIPAIPIDPDDTNGTAYTAGDETVQIATVTVDDEAFTFEDDLGISVADPADEEDEVPIVGLDNRHEYGAGVYDPAEDGYTPENADIVVSADGSGDYDSLGDAVDTSVAGDVIYVTDGTYEEARIDVANPDLTIIGDGAKIVHVSGSYLFNDDTSIDTFVAKGLEIENMAGGNNAARVSGSDFAFEYVTVSGYDTAIHSADSVVNSLIYDHDGAFFNVGETENNKLSLFSSFTLAMIDEQEDQRVEILDAFGDSSSGYLNDVWNQLETGQLSVTDILTYEQMFSQSFSEDAVGSRAWLDAQYLQAGMSGHDMQSTVVVEVPEGTDILADARLDGRTTLSDTQVYDGHLWTMHPDESGSWEVGTYDTDDLGGMVHVTYYAQRERLNDDGSIEVTTEPATVAIDGEFTVVEMIDADGESVEAVEHGGTPSGADVYDASEYADQIEVLNLRIAELQEEIEAAGSGDGGDQCGIAIPYPTLTGMSEYCTGITSFYASFLGVIAVIVGVYALMARGLPALVRG